jgi:hypothetical protein
VKAGESDEERLAQEAIAKIRAWAEKRKRAAGGDSLPRLTIKFCGGCNPSIERGPLARIIREDLTGLVRWVPAEEGMDLVLIISGCQTACADRPEVKEKAAECIIIAGRTIFSILGDEDKEQR